MDEFEPIKTYPAHERAGSLSLRIYGIHWQGYFPKVLGDSGITVHHGSFSTCAEFLKKHHASVNSTDGESSVFVGSELHPHKAKYYAEVGDFFEFKEGRETIGVFAGTPVDWSTYYLRTCVILPSHQGRGAWQLFLKHLFHVLKAHSVYRVEGDVSPANLINIHVFNKMQFNITGTIMSDRWGALIKFTKYLNGIPEKEFLDRFCYGIRPQLDGKGRA